MNPPPLIALGIDAPNTEQLDAWIAAGRLPVLAQLQREGARFTCRHTKRFRNERCWDLFLYGVEEARAGSTFLPGRYGYFNDSLQREAEPRLFYALGPTRRVCMFDLPAPIAAGVHGVQVSGWGSELNAIAPKSHPPGLIAELTERHGADPKLSTVLRVKDGASGAEERSYVLPSLYDHEATRDFEHRLRLAVERRTQIALDLLARERWDLFLALFAEPHSANHALWHLGEVHALADGGEHAVLAVTQAVDAAIGRLLAAAPAEATALVYTIDHTAANTMDVPSMALLPELLYRWCFAGMAALAPASAALPPPAPRRDYPRHWKHEVWALATDAGRAGLESPTAQEAAGEALSWNPASWYRPLWPRMRAFALPSVSDGYVRLNVRGREAAGIVEPADFAAVLGELTQLIHRLVNPRTGQPMAERIIATRQTPGDAPEIPPDLVVCWRGGEPADVMDSPDLEAAGGPGRIGPLPFFRSGGHVAHGTVVENRCFVRGAGVAPGSQWRDGALADLPATLLALMGIAPPPGLSGRPLGPLV